MRALASKAVFKQTNDGRFALTPVGQALRSDTLDTNELEDQQTQQLMKLIEAKRRAGKDVVAAPVAPEEPESTGAEIVDLMKYLKESITGKAANAESSKRKVPQAAKRKTPKTPRRRR